MVRIRMQRLGRTHRPFYRINAVDRRQKRDGRFIETLGWYDPMASDDSKRYEVNQERVKYWLGVGAQPSDTVNDLLAEAGVIDAAAWKAERQKRLEPKRRRQAAEAEAAKAAEAAAAASAATAEASQEATAEES